MMGAEGRRTQDKNENQTQFFYFWKYIREDSYQISHLVGKEGLRSIVGIEKLVI